MSLFFLFPGQGSQTPGMGRDFCDGSKVAREVFERAAALSPEGFLDTLFGGPADALARTEAAQPALLTVEVAIARYLEQRGIDPSGCAGHSLGEFSALVVAGALVFDEALALVRRRGELMAQLAPEGGMAAVMGLSPEQIEAALPDGVTVANYNGPQQTIISGTRAGLELARQALDGAGAKRVIPLNVSGPFHSPHMATAAETFAKALEGVSIQKPVRRFVSSVSANEESDPAQIRELLARQICAPVRWTQVMALLGPLKAAEVGPGKVLQGLSKRMEGAAEIESAGTLAAAGALAA